MLQKQDEVLASTWVLGGASKGRRHYSIRRRGRILSDSTWTAGAMRTLCPILMIIGTDIALMLAWAAHDQVASFTTQMVDDEASIQRPPLCCFLLTAETRRQGKTRHDSLVRLAYVHTNAVFVAWDGKRNRTRKRKRKKRKNSTQRHVPWYMCRGYGGCCVICVPVH